jgi:hypothetical protein
MKNVSAAERIAGYLLDLAEATVRRPPRSKRWVAVFTGVEPGEQVWRSTGLTDRAAALALAREWEAEARRRRAQPGRLPRKPTARVRHGSPEAAAGLLTQAEAAAILGISVRAVREIERRAFEKLRRHPALRQFWREYVGEAEEQPEESEAILSDSEVAAVMALARTGTERLALAKLLILIGVVPPPGTWSWR